jgi:hypothetical protein
MESLMLHLVKSCLDRLSKDTKLVSCSNVVSGGEVF